MPLGAVSDYLCHCTRLAKLNHRAAEGAEFLPEIVSHDASDAWIMPELFLRLVLFCHTDNAMNSVARRLYGYALLIACDVSGMNKVRVHQRASVSIRGCILLNCLG
jgi:hypothetical protein